MHKISAIFFSMITTVVLLILFAASIGYATFAENNLGTDYAQSIIYHAKWLEGLYLLLIINLLGSIFRYHLVKRQKWSVLLFHLAFILILTGAAITRFTGTEGMMHIREGASSNEVTSNKTSLRIVATYEGQNVEKSVDAVFSEKKWNLIKETLDIAGMSVTIENETFVPNAFETIVPDEQGEPAISLFVLDSESQRLDGILTKGKQIQFRNLSLAFSDSVRSADVVFTETTQGIQCISRFPVTKKGMMQQTESTYVPGTPIFPEAKTLYMIEGIALVVKTYLPKAKINLTQSMPGGNSSGIIREGKDAVVFKVSNGTQTKHVPVFLDSNPLTEAAICQIGNVRLQLSYGMLPHLLPFSITLRDFQLERYPGSHSPSSYASEITVNDAQKKEVRPYRIYMNNILNYRGYRFFQSSYDTDELGTVLSVSHDFWGTSVTYAGYFFMLLGMVWTLFNRHSRFRTVLHLSHELHQKQKTESSVSLKRKGIKTLFLAGMVSLAGMVLVDGSGSALAQTVSKKNHLNQVSQLLVQDEDQGRIEPFSTFASEVLRKITKETHYRKVSAVEVLLGMMSNPAYWQNEPIIKVANPQLEKELGGINGYVSFNQLFDFENGNAYRLNNQVEEVYSKEQTQRNKYDKEVLNVDERISICYQIYTGTMPSLMPVAGKPNALWTAAYSETDRAVVPTKAPLLHNYFSAINQSAASGNWLAANTALAAVRNEQLKYGGGRLPSVSKIKLEILYNEVSVFSALAQIYAMVGGVFLVLLLMNIFSQKYRLQKILDKTRYLYMVFFVVYSAGLVLRWYISGHAPWSNGYETMIFVGWAAALSGIIFSSKSSITLAITSVLTGIILFVAGMSWMNPEITPLVPVLKSYWLIVHVAVITSSYGFLAMGALLGLLNLVLMIARKKVRSERLRNSITEVSYIIELALIIGLMLLTVGCFIGAVWANESWGRYWGWDPKETWALVSIVVYAAILHLRNIPHANNPFVLSSLAVAGFSTILMTFFGVNYYLSGMHSYAQGAPSSIPGFAYFILAVVVALIVMAYFAQKKDTHNIER